MATKDGTFEDNFARRMPLEIKHMVFKWAVSNNGGDGAITDIEVDLARDNKQSLKSPALDLLAALAQCYPADVYKDATEYLTTPWFRWVFISHEEPHNSLLSAFYKQVPFDIRKRIKHVYLRKLRVTSLIHRQEFPVKWGMMLPLRLPKLADYSDYLRRIDGEGSRKKTKVCLALVEDIPHGIALLSLMLPSIKKLDVGLDVFDYLLEIRIVASTLSTLVADFREDPNIFSIYTAYTAAILPLKGLRRISKISMRVVWDNHFEQGDDDDPSNGEKEELQELLFNFLRKEIPAKSITSYAQE
ncbi:hypothetical protein COCMIDRAFT_3465 [Bipolaris oryzae ATCC 44560]|uniref:Uncharacterized protein n=1 Tax=Bipolaris oryzae ATCC 44560 TaxID=930090 RepID=W6ZCZ6_COCMI|nr:uncharacterized protein COCMIDRAFT_3465 [Bipolaris oryzae ATCC 44560]EUC47673.1 hypothetical protein COCMIDRAFT_3465 [Bipolaris oryzae ATCC 44560]